tara:strand:+ start:2954 stop:3139 length:186 start_codon:yes stop_codon:yes gene_type:complete
MKIENAKYTKNQTPDGWSDNKGVQCIIDGENCWVPINGDNRHYLEIMRQVDAGELTIEEAS